MFTFIDALVSTNLAREEGELFQRQGHMRKMLEDVYKIADKKGISVILDIDDKDKAARYEHLGMKLDRVRNCGEKFHMYWVSKYF